MTTVSTAPSIFTSVVDRSPGIICLKTPNAIHTLVVDDSTEMVITFFQVSGSLIYYDEPGAPPGHDDVNSKITMCRDHFKKVGLGVSNVMGQ